MTRDSLLWTITLVSSIAVFLGGQFDLITQAFPGVTAIWEARIQFVSAITGFLSGYLKMSPLRLSEDNTMAGKSVPQQTLIPMTSMPTDPESASKRKK
jgi:hypothetical protein